MNDNAQEWVADLKSSEFKQAGGRLRRDDSYCCLGVACERYRRETGDGEWTDDYRFRVGDEEVDLGLPVVVKEWYGLRSAATAITRSGDEIDYSGGTLSAHNDSGKSFEDIAAIIEGKPEGLFA